MGRMKSERHHWWPECVSKHWADDVGGVHWLKPDGTEQRAKPAAFGVIGNGHFIKLGKEAGQITPWDQNFEAFFQKADEGFPAVISWLDGLTFEYRNGRSRRERFFPQPSSDAMFRSMIEGLVSLAIRSPKTRASAVSVAEHFRGPLPERERNSLIALNLRDMHRRAADTLGVRGKATAIHSPDREFIFGDGFYHNFDSPSIVPSSARILVPLTPRLAVLYALPMQYRPEPRLSTLVVTGEETAAMNDVIQVYSCERIFYRADKPELIDDYRAGQHRRYASSRNIVETMVHDMPGVPARDTTFDFSDHIQRR